MLLSFDAGSWLTTCYVTGFVIGSGFTPCFWPTFSLRRVALTMCGIYLAGGLLTPWLGEQYGVLLAVRSLQGLRRRRVAADADDGGAAFYAAADQGAGAGCLRLGLRLERHVGRHRRRLRLSLGLERVLLLEPAADGDRCGVYRLRSAAGSAAAGAPAAVQLARPAARRRGARHADGGHFTGGAPRLAELAADLRFIIGWRRIIGVISD